MGLQWLTRDWSAAVGQQMHIDFPERNTDDDLLRRLAMAYEMAAIEGLRAVLNPVFDEKELREQCAAGAWRVFEAETAVPPS